MSSNLEYFQDSPSDHDQQVDVLKNMAAEECKGGSEMPPVDENIDHTVNHDQIASDTNQTCEDAEEHVCRVCHESFGVLYHPCRCSGSIRYVHQDCLITWLKISRQLHTEACCELCGSKFVFRSVYKTGGSDPPSLSILEFISGLLPRVATFISDLADFSIIIFFWLFCLPLLVETLIELSALLASQESATTFKVPITVAALVTNWWNGLLITMFIAFVSISMFHFGNAVRQEFMRVQLENDNETLHAPTPAGQDVDNNPQAEAEAPVVINHHVEAPVPNINLQDLGLVNGQVDLTLEKFVYFAAYNLAFTIAFHLLPIVIGKVALRLVGLKTSVLEHRFDAWVAALLVQHRTHADELHLHLYGAPLPTNEITSRQIWSKMLICLELGVGLGVMVVVGGVAAVLYTGIYHRKAVSKVSHFLCVFTTEFRLPDSS